MQSKNPHTHALIVICRQCEMDKTMYQRCTTALALQSVVLDRQTRSTLSPKKRAVADGNSSMTPRFVDTLSINAKVKPLFYLLLEMYDVHQLLVLLIACLISIISCKSYEQLCFVQVSKRYYYCIPFCHLQWINLRWYGTWNLV